MIVMKNFKNGAVYGSPALPLSDHERRRIIERSDEHSRWLEDNRLVYPDPEELEKITGEQLASLGFDGDFDYQVDILNARKKRRKTARKQKTASGKPRIADPVMVHEKVSLYLEDFPEAGVDGNLRMASFNMEFLDDSKARFFEASYREILSRHHVLFGSEVAPSGLAELARITGYEYYCSVENNRNQAVGFLLHPRLVIVGEPVNYHEVAEVEGIPNLRPAFRIDVVDSATAENHSFVVVHQKSMRGGPKGTAKIRYRQNQALAEALGTEFCGTIAGDFNTFLGSTEDTDPLSNSGFQLLSPGDESPTHIMGGRLDGFFTRDCQVVGDYKVRNFWRSLRRDLSDHGCLTAENLVCNKPSPDDCFDPESTSDPFSPLYDGDCEVRVD